MKREITDQKVEEAIIALRAEGTNPSYSNIIKKTKCGGKDTLKKILDANPKLRELKDKPLDSKKVQSARPETSSTSPMQNKDTSSLLELETKIEAQLKKIDARLEKVEARFSTEEPPANPTKDCDKVAQERDKLKLELEDALAKRDDALVKCDEATQKMEIMAKEYDEMVQKCDKMAKERDEALAERDKAVQKLGFFILAAKAENDTIDNKTKNSEVKGGKTKASEAEASEAEASEAEASEAKASEAEASEAEASEAEASKAKASEAEASEAEVSEAVGSEIAPIFRVLDIAKEHPELTSEQISNQTGINKSTVVSDLNGGSYGGFKNDSAKHAEINALRKEIKEGQKQIKKKARN